MLRYLRCSGCVSANELPILASRWIGSRSNGPWRTAKQRPRTGSSARSLPGRRRRTAKIEDHDAIGTSGHRGTQKRRAPGRGEARLVAEIASTSTSGSSAAGILVVPARAHLFDDAVLMDAEETIKDRGSSAGRWRRCGRRTGKEDEQHLRAVARPGWAPVPRRRFGSPLQAPVEPSRRHRRRDCLPRRLPKLRKTRSTNASLLCESRRRAASTVALRGCLSKEIPRSRRACVSARTGATPNEMAFRGLP